MTFPEDKTAQSGAKVSLAKRFHKFRSSIYGQVIFIITVLSLILFLTFGIIFRKVNEEHLNTVIKEVR